MQTSLGRQMLADFDHNALLAIAESARLRARILESAGAAAADPESTALFADAHRLRDIAGAVVRLSPAFEPDTVEADRMAEFMRTADMARD